MQFNLDIKPEAHQDIQEGIDWYNSKQSGLGRRFHAAVKLEFKILEKNPLFQIRYDDIRCMPMSDFPYMIHFIVEENSKQVVILGVIGTHKDPAKWHKR